MKTESKIIFDIKDNLNGERVRLTTNINGHGIMIEEVPEGKNRKFIRITRRSNCIDLVAGENGMVPFKGSKTEKVGGFVNSVCISIPEYLLPLLKEAVNSID